MGHLLAGHSGEHVAAMKCAEKMEGRLRSNREWFGRMERRSQRGNSWLGGQNDTDVGVFLSETKEARTTEEKYNAL